MKKVSVCMLSYNVGKFLGQAIESVLMQKTNFEIEIVIAEDRSTDNTRKIAAEYKAKYPETINLVLNPVNLGLSANYINAFNHCTAPYIAILDGDDFWYDPYKLQRQIDFLEEHDDYGVVYSDCMVVDMNGNEFEWEELKSYRQQFTSGNLFFKLLEAGAFIPTLTTCFRKSLIAEELKMKSVWFFEDWWLWMRLAQKTKFHYQNMITACYRVHHEGYTKTRTRDKNLARFYRKKWYAIYYSNVTYFSRLCNYIPSREEQKLFFRKILMLLYRPYGSIAMKIGLIPLIFKHYPGIVSLKQIVHKKLNGGKGEK